MKDSTGCPTNWKTRNNHLTLLFFLFRPSQHLLYSYVFKQTVLEAAFVSYLINAEALHGDTCHERCVALVFNGHSYVFCYEAAVWAPLCNVDLNFHRFFPSFSCLFLSHRDFYEHRSDLIRILHTYYVIVLISWLSLTCTVNSCFVRLKPSTGNSTVWTLPDQFREIEAKNDYTVSLASIDMTSSFTVRSYRYDVY